MSQGSLQNNLSSYKKITFLILLVETIWFVFITPQDVIFFFIIGGVIGNIILKPSNGAEDFPYAEPCRNMLWRLWEQGIHPPVRLKYFNDVRFEAVKALWQRFCKKWSKPDKKTATQPKATAKPVWAASEAFEYESCEYKASREELHWRWMRVYEFYKEKNAEQRYEYQEAMAQKFMNRHHIDRMLIHYNY
jgi:hypothetical protein